MGPRAFGVVNSDDCRLPVARLRVDFLLRAPSLLLMSCGSPSPSCVLPPKLLVVVLPSRPRMRSDIVQSILSCSIACFFDSMSMYRVFGEEARGRSVSESRGSRGKFEGSRCGLTLRVVRLRFEVLRGAVPLPLAPRRRLSSLRPAGRRVPSSRVATFSFVFVI